MSYRDNWQGTDFRLHCGIKLQPCSRSSAESLRCSRFSEQTTMTLGTAYSPVHPTPTRGTSSPLNAFHFLRCDCKGERTDPTPMEAAIKLFRWLARVLSIFLSQGLVSYLYWLQLGSRKEKATWILSSTVYLEGRLSHLQPTFSPQRDVHRQKQLHSWYGFSGGCSSLQCSRMCVCFLPALGQNLAAHGKLSLKKTGFSIKADKLYPTKKLWKIKNLQQKGHDENLSGGNNWTCRSCFFWLFPKSF